MPMENSLTWRSGPAPTDFGKRPPRRYTGSSDGPHAIPVVNAVIFQNIPGEDGFCFIGFDSGWCDGICCFHVAVAVIYSNDFCVSEFSHKKHLHFRID